MNKELLMEKESLRRLYKQGKLTSLKDLRALNKVTIEGVKKFHDNQDFKFWLRAQGIKSLS